MQLVLKVEKPRDRPPEFGKLRALMKESFCSLHCRDLLSADVHSDLLEDAARDLS